jgi:hypothetical protein
MLLVYIPTILKSHSGGTNSVTFHLCLLGQEVPTRHSWLCSMLSLPVVLAQYLLGNDLLRTPFNVAWDLAICVAIKPPPGRYFLSSLFQLTSQFLKFKAFLNDGYQLILSRLSQMLAAPILAGLMAALLPPNITASALPKPLSEATLQPRQAFAS